jgi:shikimate kinase
VNLVLVGYRGTGKSRVAHLLGEALGRPVVSLDEEIARAAGCSIPELVKARGWAHFRDLEEELCRRWGKEEGRVIDCGGGVVECGANFESLRRNGRVFWLRASVPTIVSRIGGDTERPSLTGSKTFTEEVEEVLARRTPLYERLAHLAVDTDGRSVEEIAAEIERDFRAAEAH